MGWMEFPDSLHRLLGIDILLLLPGSGLSSLSEALPSILFVKCTTSQFYYICLPMLPTLQMTCLKMKIKQTLIPESRVQGQFLQAQEKCEINQVSRYSKKKKRLRWVISRVSLLIPKLLQPHTHTQRHTTHIYILNFSIHFPNLIRTHYSEGNKNTNK